ncbi:MAG: TolC family protein, partial [Lentisphaeria bacterium]|nr:TolC family protein [Lentisphaeria bacterium]
VVAARAARLPTLSLSASVALSSPDIGRIFDNWLASLAANLVAPILDGGRRKAVVNRDRALADARFIAYRDTVLVAMREVTEALVRERWRGEALSRLQSEADYATQMLEETQRRYRNGLSDYLPVLSAFSIKQNADRALVRARHSLLANRVSLHQALGGTWMNSLVESNE